MGILHHLLVSSLPLIPRPVMRRLSARYIAGETLEEALGVLRSNAAAGYQGVLDILGESVADEAAAREAHRQYREAASALAEAGLDAYVSIKPTHFGQNLSLELARELYDDLLTHCASLGQFARVEMEDAPTADATIELFHGLRAKHDNVGLVLQSRLHRTLRDIEELPEATCDVRMVKGIYLEPAEIAHTAPNPIRDAFVECCEALFARGHRVAFATHDGDLAGRLLRAAHDKGVDPQRYYFEVLMGVRDELWKRWLDGGSQVRVYVPYGPEWRSYSQRRLRKNPEVFRHLIRNTLRLG